MRSRGGCGTRTRTQTRGKPGGGPDEGRRQVKFEVINGPRGGNATFDGARHEM